MIATHKIIDIIFDQDWMILNVDGKPIRILIETISSRLKLANDYQRNNYKISPSGYGIHWPMIDEDISIEAVLKSR